MNMKACEPGRSAPALSAILPQVLDLKLKTAASARHAAELVDLAQRMDTAATQLEQIKRGEKEPAPPAGFRPGWHRPKEAKEILKIGTTALQARINDGTFRTRKIGGARLIWIDAPGQEE